MFRSPFADGVVVLIILLLFFGPKRLPMLSRSIGESIREFKGGIAEAHGDKPELKSENPEVVPAESAPVRDTAETGPEPRS